MLFLSSYNKKMDECIPMEIESYTIDQVRQQMQEQIKVNSEMAAFILSQRQEPMKSKHEIKNLSQHQLFDYGLPLWQHEDQNK
jgi:hypothetical protein